MKKHYNDKTINNNEVLLLEGDIKDLEEKIDEYRAHQKLIKFENIAAKVFYSLIPIGVVAITLYNLKNYGISFTDSSVISSNITYTVGIISTNILINGTFYGRKERYEEQENNIINTTKKIGYLKKKLLEETKEKAVEESRDKTITTIKPIDKSHDFSNVKPLTRTKKKR